MGSLDFFNLSVSSYGSDLHCECLSSRSWAVFIGCT